MSIVRYSEQPSQEPIKPGGIEFGKQYQQRSPDVSSVGERRQALPGKWLATPMLQGGASDPQETNAIGPSKALTSQSEWKKYVENMYTQKPIGEEGSNVETAVNSPEQAFAEVLSNIGQEPDLLNEMPQQTDYLQFGAWRKKVGIDKRIPVYSPLSVEKLRESVNFSPRLNELLKAYNASEKVLPADMLEIMQLGFDEQIFAHGILEAARASFENYFPGTHLDEPVEVVIYYPTKIESVHTAYHGMLQGKHYVALTPLLTDKEFAPPLHNPFRVADAIKKGSVLMDIEEELLHMYHAMQSNQETFFGINSQDAIDSISADTLAKMSGAEKIKYIQGEQYKQGGRFSFLDRAVKEGFALVGGDYLAEKLSQETSLWSDKTLSLSIDEWRKNEADMLSEVESKKDTSSPLSKELAEAYLFGKEVIKNLLVTLSMPVEELPTIIGKIDLPRCRVLTDTEVQEIKADPLKLPGLEGYLSNQS